MEKDDKEEFKRPWVEQSGKFLAEKNLGGSTNAFLLAQDQADLARHVCDAMGREKCGAWYGKLYDLHLDTLIATGLPGMDDLRDGQLNLTGPATGGKQAASASTPTSKSCSSFSGETHVLMADGSRKPISEVRAGDRVIAEDPETGERGPRTVTHAWVHGDTLYDFKVADDRVVTTEDHPFWNRTAKKWQRADGIPPGDEVETASHGPAAVRGIEFRSGHFDAAYNLTVDDLHTYYVFAGNASILVHNTESCFGPVQNPSRGSTARRDPVDWEEELLLEVRGNPESGVELWKVPQTDPRWPRDKGWVKMEQTVDGVDIHYQYQTTTGAVDDLKVKDHIPGADGRR
jgi:hypothetical protein